MTAPSAPMWYLHTLYYLQMCRARDDAIKRRNEARHKKKQEQLNASMKAKTAKRQNAMSNALANARTGLAQKVKPK